MRLEYSPQAQDDRLRIWLEGAERFGPDSAIAYVARFDGTLIKILETFPNAGRLRSEFGPDIRSLPIVPYVAFYRVKNRRVVVLRIVHGHRDLTQPILSLLVAI